MCITHVPVEPLSEYSWIKPRVYRYSTGGTVPVRIDLDQIDKFSSDTTSLRTIPFKLLIVTNVPYRY